MVVPLISQAPELPDAVRQFTMSRLQQLRGQRQYVDVRFSKSRNPAYDATHKKNYVNGYSGWLTIDPLARKIVLTVITPGASRLYKSKECTTFVKHSYDYTYTFDEAFRMQPVGTVKTVLKRMWSLEKETIDETIAGLMLHQMVEIQHPHSVAKAPFNHQPIRAAGNSKGIKWETVQREYDADLGKVAAKRSPIPMTTRAMLFCCVEVAVALSRIHQMGILHCDVRPPNVLLENMPEGKKACLNDFGLAQRCFDDEVEGAPYVYWDSLAESGVFHYFTDIYGLAISVGQILWGMKFYNLAKDKTQLKGPLFAALAAEPIQNQPPGQPSQQCRHTAYRLINEVIQADSKLTKLYNDPSSLALPYRQRLERLSKQHVSAQAFADNLRQLIGLLEP